MKGFQLPGALALGIMTVWYTGPVSAQPVINGTFYEENVSTNCDNVSGSWCDLQFTQLSSRVLFTKLACQVSNVPASNHVYQAKVGVRDTSHGPLRRFEYVPVNQPLIVANGLRYYSMSTPLDFLFAAGRYPAILIDIDGTGGNASCKLTGRIQP